jgi:hypothetical protein
LAAIRWAYRVSQIAWHWKEKGAQDDAKMPVWRAFQTRRHAGGIVSANAVFAEISDETLDGAHFKLPVACVVVSLMLVSSAANPISVGAAPSGLHVSLGFCAFLAQHTAPPSIVRTQRLTCSTCDKCSMPCGACSGGEGGPRSHKGQWRVLRCAWGRAHRWPHLLTLTSTSARRSQRCQPLCAIPRCHTACQHHVWRRGIGGFFWEDAQHSSAPKHTQHLYRCE